MDEKSSVERYIICRTYHGLDNGYFLKYKYNHSKLEIKAEEMTSYKNIRCNAD